MIELTPEQRPGLMGSGPIQVRDPVTNEAYVLLRKDEYERLAGEEYEYGPMTDEERDVLLAEMDEMLDDDLAVEDDA